MSQAQAQDGYRDETAGAWPGAYAERGERIAAASRLDEALELLEKHLLYLDETQMQLASSLRPVSRSHPETELLAKAQVRDNACPPDASPIIQRIHHLAGKAAEIHGRLVANLQELDL